MTSKLYETALECYCQARMNITVVEDLMPIACADCVTPYCSLADSFSTYWLRANSFQQTAIIRTY